MVVKFYKFDYICRICSAPFKTNRVRQVTCSYDCRKKNEHNLSHKNTVRVSELDKDYDITKISGLYLKLRFEVLKRDNFTCQYCGRNPKEDNCKLHVDHIVAKNAGGKDTISNLTTSCLECNLGKVDVLLELRELRKKEKQNG